MFRKILRYASQHDSAVWEFLEATTVIHKKSIKDWSNLEDAMFESFTKLRLEPANNCEQGKHTGKLSQKIVLACQTFGWGLLWGNNSRNFPLRPRGPTLLLIFTWIRRALSWYQSSVHSWECRPNRDTPVHAFDQLLGSSCQFTHLCHRSSIIRILATFKLSIV